LVHCPAKSLARYKGYRRRLRAQAGHHPRPRRQTVRLVAGTIQYIDAQGQPIKLEESRTEPTLKFATYGCDRLDPGQEATQSLDVDFPAEALKAKKLKEIRLELAYIPSPYREETVNFIVSIGGQ
jgi:hypothetical protein